LDERLEELTGDDVADVMFTSGTTGRPKGVQATHAQNLRGYYDWSCLAGFEPDDRYAIINPFFHAFGYKVGWLAALMHGITIFPHRVLDVPMLLAQVEEQRISLLPGPPTLYTSILEQMRVSRHGLDSLRLAVTGAAVIPPVLIQRMYEDLGFARVTTCYGQTEGTGIATVTRAGDKPLRVALTSGSALPDVELRIVPTGGDATPDGTGEIWIRGYNVTQGYFDDREATAQLIDGDGWMHTGDVGVLDDDGRLRVTDRLKDMFIVGGFNAYPAEIESMMAEHPAIVEVSVIGVPDERLGEVGCAFVVARESEPVEAGDLLTWCRARMANYKVPRVVHFVEDLPRNATGKVLKTTLRAQLHAASRSPGGAGR
jgi:acyl-CoA synthetase (AMP-forming)/AMP-acid ligase II